MASILAAVLLLQAPDPIAAESKFRAILEQTEKAGLAVPELPDGAAELEKLLGASKNLPKELRDRYAVVRAQSAVLASLHALLLNRKGGLMDVPVPPGEPIPVKIVEASKRGVRISRAEGEQEIAYSDLDAEWVLSEARAGIAGMTDPSLVAGLWLAKAARWDAAFLAFANVDTDHPLAAEARKRGLEVTVAAVDSITRGKRWAEALAKIETLEKLSPGDDRLKTARGRLLDAMVEHGKDLSRKKSKGPMQDLIDFIAKHFPDGASRIEDIREAGRWVKVTDPKRFKIESPKGPPWLLEPKGEDTISTAWMQPSAEKYEGVAAVIRIPKGEKTMGGLSWNDRRNIVSMSWENSQVGVYEGNKGELLPEVFFKKVAMEGRHHVSVRHRAGEFVVQYNGEEIYRSEGKANGFELIGLNAHGGKAWFDEVWLLKKE